MTDYKHILAIDTATGPCSVALGCGNKILSYIENREISAQSARLVPMIEKALAESHLGYPDLSAVACTVGPGSFTGLRVGLSSARAIGLAANLPVLGYTTLEVLAYASKLHTPGSKLKKTLAIINAGKGEYYYQLFSLMPFASLSEAVVGDIAVAKSLAGKDTAVAGFESDILTFPSADYLALLAASQLLPPRTSAPFYIRPPDAKPMALITQ